MLIKSITNPSDVLPLIKATMPIEVCEHAVDVLSAPCEDRKLWGWYIGDTLIGCCGYFRSEQQYWISWTAVNPNYQGRGIGQHLLSHVIKDLKKLTKTVYVETYEHPSFFRAIGFYLKNGFRLCGFLEDYLTTGETCLYLKKNLTGD